MARSARKGGRRRICRRRTIVSATTSATLLLLLLRAGDNEIGAGWVDPDTREEYRATTAYTKGDDRAYKLVFSDEFEKDGRTFADGNDPRWTAINKNDYTNEALHYYSHDNARTTNGVLNITTELKENAYKAFDEEKKVYYADKKHVQTAMLQGWNKFCLTGGIIEFSAKLPGKPSTGGLWPALWLLGNLARATYVGSSDYMWPFSYDTCNEQTRVSQEINACSKVNHYGLEPGVGRGAPEIDILEGMGGEPGHLPNTHIERPYFSASLQIAPGVKNDRPILGKLPRKGHWYEGLQYGKVTNSSLNPFFYGVTLVHKPKAYTYQSDALSANMHIKKTHFKDQHVYRVEWEPPKEDGTGGYVKWYCDGEFVYGIHADSLKLTGAKIPSEPMYLIMNTAVASSWGFPKPCPEGCDCECYNCHDADCRCGLPAGYCENFPASFEIDYVRVYQAVNETNHVLGCSTEKRPTKLFIEGHKKRYMQSGQKQPLLPIQKGDAPCKKSAECGGEGHGTCSDKGRCTCLKGFTGPTCLSSDAFDDFASEKLEFELEHMVLPSGLLVLLVSVAVSFCVALGFSIVRKRKEDALYQKISSNGPTQDTEMAQVPMNMDGSYQNNPNIPPVQHSGQQKVVTYCMIDGRLIDE